MAFLQLQYSLSLRSAARPLPTGLVVLLLLASSCACASAAAAAAAAAAPASASSSSTSDFVFGSVGIYHRTDAPAGQAVLDFKWDQAPQHLRNQLEAFGLKVVPVTSPGEAELTAIPGAEAAKGAGGRGSGGGLHAYVIPPANGPTFYTAAEDMAAVATFVREGGLVVTAEGNQGAESTKAFVQQALGYTGSWLTCREVGSNRHSPLGRLERSERFTSQFLPYSPPSIWVSELEDADTVVAHSWCIHDDPGFVSWPLYTSKEERFKVVAQAFGKVGTPGAVVWLGYNWRGGPQKGWGALLAAIIQEFAFRSLDPMSDKMTTDGFAEKSEQELELYDSLDPVFEDLDNLGNSLLRRFMTTTPGTYPSPTGQPPTRGPHPPLRSPPPSPPSPRPPPSPPPPRHSQPPPPPPPRHSPPPPPPPPRHSPPPPPPLPRHYPPPPPPPPRHSPPPPPPPRRSPPPPPPLRRLEPHLCEKPWDASSSRFLSSSMVLYKGAGVAMLYYDVRTTCPTWSQIATNTDSVPACGDDKGPGMNRTLRQLGSNVVAIKPELLASKLGRTRYCGKKVTLYFNNHPIAAPDGGDFFVWDSYSHDYSLLLGVGVSVSALQPSPNVACSVLWSECIQWEVVDEQVKSYRP